MDAVKKLTFKKEERLTSKKLFEQLFEGGQALFSHPIKLQFVEVPVTENPFPVQVAFVVSKRNFKNAVDRNRIKRQMREVYRLNKTALYEKCQLRNKNLALLFIYVAKTKSDFKLIEKKMILLMKELMVDKQVS